MRESPAYLQDDKHHGGWVIILTAVGLVLLVLCLLIRLYVRLRYRSTLHTADAVLGIAGLFAIVQSGLVFWEVDKGLGTSPELLSSHTIGTLQKSSYAATVLYLFAVYLSKCCVGCVYLHLSPERKLRWATYTVLALSSAWVVCSILLVGIDCQLIQPWHEVATRCSNSFLRWQIVAGLDVTTEILLFLLSILLVAGTQMIFKRKSIVITAFGTRLLVIVPCLIRLHCLYLELNSPTPTVTTATTFIWTEIQLHFSVICGVTYCFRSFTNAVSTNYGCAVINLEVYEETNGNVSAYANSRRPSSRMIASGSLKSDRFVGHNGRYANTTIITAGARTPSKRTGESRKSGESTMVIIQEEIHIESGRATPTQGLTVERV